MKLSNFSQDKLLDELRGKIGANMSKSWPAYEWKGIGHDILEGLKEKAGIEVPIGEIITSDDGTLEYKGRKIIVYIRDQHYHPHYGEREYKFHIADCRTLDNMRGMNRYEDRYVVTQNIEGTFLVNIIQGKILIQEMVEKELKVCKNCLNILHYKGYPRNKETVYREFNPQEFFKRYSTEIIDLPKRDEHTAPIDKYSDHMSEISKRFREEAEWRCNKCKYDCSHVDMRKFLHAHHIDGNKGNNSWSNLEALCILCHSLVPGHDWLKNNPDYNQFIQEKIKS